jgi:hypothetical protein
MKDESETVVSKLQAVGITFWRTNERVNRLEGVKYLFHE